MSLIISLLSAWLLALSGGPLSFDAADAAFQRDADYAKSRSLLLEMLPKAETPAQKAEVYWRLSRAENMLGEGVTTKEEKRKHFGQGIRYAEEAIAADSKNYNGYMWHCANVGRDVQTKPLTQQTSAVPVMIKDLDTILETLGRKDCSEAWQAKSEIYWHHPFKSNDTAVEYARKAVRTIPNGELRLRTRIWLAEILYERNKGGDRAEAKTLLSDARKRYESLSQPTPAERKDFKKLVALENKCK